MKIALIIFVFVSTLTLHASSKTYINNDDRPSRLEDGQTDTREGQDINNNELFSDNGKAVYLYTAQIIQYINKDIRFGVSANIYDSLKGQSPYYKYKAGENSKGQGKNISKGNTLDENGNYKNNFQLYELFAQYQATKSLAFGFDFIYNAGASNENIAYNMSIMYGKLKENGDFKCGYYFRDTQRDAVLGAFSDSDFADGYTGSKGHQLMAGYQLIKNLQLAATYIHSKTDKYINSYEDFERLHLDIKYKF